MNKTTENKGITLIALVITIIVLLILAGLTLTFVLGENGLFGKARQAKIETDKAQSIEDIKLKILEVQADAAQEGRTATLEDLYNKLKEVQGQEYKVTKEAQAASLAAGSLTSWENATKLYIRNMKYSYVVEVGSNLQVENDVQTASGSGSTSGGSSGGSQGTPATTGSNVTMVTVNTGETVPVPSGFYYVGGDLSTGVVISDSSSDNNKYANDTNKDVGTDLAGNQFVWIPCTTNNYTKTDWGEESAGWDNTTPSLEIIQIGKYGGFYVARYEAGLANTIQEFTTEQEHTGSNHVYNQNGVPQSKAGLVPWNFIDWTHAKANAESMKNDNYVSSGLITGTQWDVILNTFKSKAGLSDSDITSSGSWGNYKNTAIAYTGRLARADYNSTNSNAWTLKPFGTATTGTTSSYTSNNGDLLTTGASDTTQKYHIFDIAGNLWEWTEEDSHYQTSGQYRVLRGGSCVHTSSDRPACYRSGSDPDYSIFLGIGFRAVLYIK